MGLLDSQENYDERTGILARNLEIGAALCKAFELGRLHKIKPRLDANGAWRPADNR